MQVFDEGRHLYEGLTRHNYFPNQKEGVGELPPCFSTRKYTPEIVEMLVSVEESRERKKLGYDQVEYLVTRHDNVPRLLGLIHPRAYASLSKAIYDNWGDLGKIKENERSMIKPEQHVDGRVMIMNYADVLDQTRQTLSDGFGKRFRVHSDISSCFHSIYTHSIPWAVIGFENAKKEMTKKGNTNKAWYNKLDKLQRMAKRNETQGIAIGPATSSIVVELVLGKIDRALVDQGFEFRRYIDDYTCYCETHEKAQQFIHVLGRELSAYKLTINLHKTKIIELPEPTNDDWVSKLVGALPTNFVDENFSRRALLEHEIIHYLDLAVRLNKTTPDGSVLKYAVSSIIQSISESAVESVLNYILNLSWHYPVLLPYLENLFSVEHVDVSKYSFQLNAIIAENARNRRSDGMAWPLYYLKKHSLTVSNEAFSETLRSKDCVSLLSLYATGSLREHVIEFANNLLCKSEYEKDQYWLLLYQLYKDGQIRSPYENDQTFKLMKKHKVDFMPEKDVLTKAEQYCVYFNNPFRELLEKAESTATFPEWLNNS